MADKELEELEKEALAEVNEDQDTEAEVEDNEEESENEDSVEEAYEQDSDIEPDVEYDEDNDPEEEEGTAEPSKDDRNNSDNEYGIKLDKPVKIKARGMEIDINDPKELVELAHKGFDYFKKTQELAKWRKDIQVIEEGQLSPEELKLLADVKSGNKEAVSALLNTYGFDPLDIEPEHGVGYKPNIPDVNYEIESIVQEIQSDPEHAQHFSQVANAVPDDFLNEVASDPVKLMHFNDHVKKGIADKVIPEAMKAQMMYGGSFFDHYTRIGQQLLAEQFSQQSGSQQQEPQVRVERQKPLDNREKELRRKATTPKRGGGKKTSFLKDAESIWEMDDESFAKLTAKDLQ